MSLKIPDRLPGETEKEAEQRIANEMWEALKRSSKRQQPPWTDACCVCPFYRGSSGGDTCSK